MKGPKVLSTMGVTLEAGFERYAGIMLGYFGAWNMEGITGFFFLK